MGHVDSLPARRAPLLGVLVAVAAILTLLLGAQQAHAAACTTTWKETTTGSGVGRTGLWDDINNWDAGVPDATDVACIPWSGNYQVAIGAESGNEGNATATAKELHFGGSSGSQSILISGVKVGTTDYPASLALAGGVGSASDISDHGLIQIQKATGGEASICAGSPLTNNGTIQTLGAAVAHLGGQIDNKGTLTVDIDTDDVPSALTCGANVLKNSGGTITVGASRKLTVSGSFVQSSGTTTGPVVIDGGHIAPSGGTGTFSMQKSTILDSDVAAGITLNVEGTAAQHGALGVPAAQTNNGTINLTSLDSSHGTLLTPTGTFTNLGTINVLLGAGGIRDFGGTIDNQGTFSIGAVHATNEFSPTLHLTNTGAVTIAAGGSFSPVDLTQSGGTVTVDGTLDYDSNTLSLGGGTLKGTGTVKAGTVTNSGATVAPGDSPGTLAVDGNYSQGAGGTLDVEVQGPNPGTEFDQLYVTGNASLNGTLNVTTTGGQHDTYPILQAQQVTGTFSLINQTGQNYGVQVNSNNVTLVAAPFSTAKPSITGVARVGNTLTCLNGIWVPQGSPLMYAYRWLRDGQPLAATTATRKVLAADQGHKLACRVTATNAGGSVPATSNPRSVPREPVDRGRFTKHTLRATKAGDVMVPVRNPNPLGTAGALTLRNAKGKVVGSAKFTIGAQRTKTVKVHLKSGAFAKLLATGQLKYKATLVLSKGTVKRTTRTSLTVNKPKP
jgi:hypothetical protein